MLYSICIDDTMGSPHNEVRFTNQRQGVLSTKIIQNNNVWKFELNWSSKLRDNNETQTPLSHEVVCYHASLRSI